MPRFRYAGGDQRPDAFGTLTVGDVLELAQKPEWGDWENTTKAAERASTAQPVEDAPEQPAPSVDPAKEG